MNYGSVLSADYTASQTCPGSVNSKFAHLTFISGLATPKKWADLYAFLLYELKGLLDVCRNQDRNNNGHYCHWWPIASLYFLCRKLNVLLMYTKLRWNPDFANMWNVWLCLRT